ncbi:unnamed protein product, partial [Prunus brigantina]
QYQNYLNVLNHTILAAEYSLKYTVTFNLITKRYVYLHVTAYVSSLSKQLTS